MGLSPARRRWLQSTAAWAAAGLGTACTAPAAPGAVDASAASPWRGAGDPFRLGVASGLPRPDGATIWTRLATEPLADGGGLPPVPVQVRWEVHDDARAQAPVASGLEAAVPEWSHSVRVEVSGLEPVRVYRYRFTSGDAASTTGRFRTAPAAGAGDRLRLVYASCQHYEQGRYGAWRQAVADAPDLIAFLGDYIYEGRAGGTRMRLHDDGVPKTLAAYRRRHALYRTDADLQAAHAACAWVMTWDDHEVDNDYAADLSQHGQPPAEFLAQRAAAYRAYFEHMPLPWSMAPRGPDMRVYGHLDWGGLARVHLLDDRQYRSPQACNAPGHGGSRSVGAECAQRLDPTRTLLGAQQEAWFARTMRASRARWNVVAQQTLIGRSNMRPPPVESWWTDGWDGYPAARQRLLEAVRASGAANPIAIGGDVHCFYAGELHEDFDRPSARAAMLEFVGTSITSRTWPQARIDAVLSLNPNLRYGEGRFRGYTRIDFTRAAATVTMRGLDDPTDAASAARTLRTFELRDGQARLDA